MGTWSKGSKLQNDSYGMTISLLISASLLHLLSTFYFQDMSDDDDFSFMPKPTKMAKFSTPWSKETEPIDSDYGEDGELNFGVKINQEGKRGGKKISRGRGGCKENGDDKRRGS